MAGGKTSGCQPFFPKRCYDFVSIDFHSIFDLEKCPLLGKISKPANTREHLAATRRFLKIKFLSIWSQFVNCFGKIFTYFMSDRFKTRNWRCRIFTSIYRFGIFPCSRGPFSRAQKLNNKSIKTTS